MKVIRATEINTDAFEVGDIIKFSLIDGENIEAMAVKQEEDGVVFCTIDCLMNEYSMNKENTNLSGYEGSDLRKKLNSEILGRFPKEIRGKLIAFGNGDLLRIPTESEIFGKNIYGKNESESIIQWEPMKDRRNRIAFQGSKTGTREWYWLQNKTKDSATNFVSVYSYGFANYGSAPYSGGVRIVFKLSQ